VLLTYNDLDPSLDAQLSTGWRQMFAAIFYADRVNRTVFNAEDELREFRTSRLAF
jgi:hypothetical protein